MYFLSMGIILIHKNLNVSIPIGKKCKGQMNELNVFWFGVPHLHLYINIYIDGDAGRRIEKHLFWSFDPCTFFSKGFDTF